MSLAQLLIESEHLKMVINAPKYEFAQDIYKEFSREITKYMNWEPFESLEDVLISIKKRYKKIIDGKDIALRIINKKTGEFIGIGTITEINTSTPELGIWIKKSAHGHHYGKESVSALKDWAEKNLSYKYLKYPVDKNNVASLKLIKSLGGIKSRSYEEKISSGKILNTIEYRLHKKLHKQAN